MDFLEKLNQNKDPNHEETVKDLSSHQQKLVEEKAQLASELARVQNLLKLQVDIDKENSSLQQNEVDTVRSRIKESNKRIGELTLVIQQRTQKLLSLQKSVGPSGLTEADLEKFNQEMNRLQKESTVAAQAADVMSEFSHVTDESEIGP